MVSTDIFFVYNFTYSVQVEDVKLVLHKLPLNPDQIRLYFLVCLAFPAPELYRLNCCPTFSGQSIGHWLPHEFFVLFFDPVHLLNDQSTARFVVQSWLDIQFSLCSLSLDVFHTIINVISETTTAFLLSCSLMPRAMRARISACLRGATLRSRLILLTHSILIYAVWECLNLFYF